MIIFFTLVSLFCSLNATKQCQFREYPQRYQTEKECKEQASSIRSNVTSGTIFFHCIKRKEVL